MASPDTPSAEIGSRRESRRGQSFFLRMAWLTLAVAVVGFAKTFFWPVFNGTFKGTTVFYVHGGLLFGWLGLFVAQSLLVRRRKIGVHQTLGWLTVVLVPAIVISTLAVGVASVKRDVAAGAGPEAVSAFVGVCTAMTAFSILVALAIGYRQRPEFHKRLMFLATLSILWPATFRFRHYFPGVPRPDVVFAVILPDIIILAAMLRDKMTLGRVHVVYLFAGVTLMLEQIAEVILFDSPSWRRLAEFLFGIVS